ncbi:E3 ubiquitin-protein ligase BRE1-like protein [Zostera marina]|uniref:E3 ubiquitin protein ligase n=1 Tax=Zostera marina TaxID=29655 RepID=A0A0K9PBN4_ZOSMR|nr:E3 ubiquitin-protein ligase BRE1-like protein [Zostera marina]
MQISSISSPGKRNSFSEDKKLDSVVLQYQNQKLIQQLEAQNIEYSFLEKKLEQLKDRQKHYNHTLELVDMYWGNSVKDLASSSNHTRESFNDALKSHSDKNDFPQRNLEPGVTRLQNMSTSQMNKDKQILHETTSNTIQKNMQSSVDILCYLNDAAYSTALGALSKDVSKSLQLQKECESLRGSLSDLHTQHRSIANVLQTQRDTEAKYVSEQKRLEGELESTNIELEESKSELVLLKSKKDSGQRTTPYPFPSLGSNALLGDNKSKDNEKELHDMQSTNKELLDLASNYLFDITELHQKRIETFKRLSSLQCTSDVHSVLSSNTFQSLVNQVNKSKFEFYKCRGDFDELQLEKDNLIWRERELLIKHDLADISHREITVAKSQIVEFENMLKKLLDEKVLLESKLEEMSRESGRNEIIGEFKALVASLPMHMDRLQLEISEYKDDSSILNSCRAENKSLKNILERKDNELNNISSQYNNQLSELKNLRAKLRNLQTYDQDLRLFLAMYRREAASPRDVVESLEAERKALGQVQSLQSSLEEHSLESRVKEANESEANSQQKLAATEAEIADLRQKLQESEREVIKLSDVLNSKREEGESYLSEIESIGQAYEDVQNKNQHLLQQVTERDDYNIKLAVECVKARQAQQALEIDIDNSKRAVQQGSISLDIYGQKSTKLDDLLRVWSEQVGKFTEENRQGLVGLENIKKRREDVQNNVQMLRKEADEWYNKVQASRRNVNDMRIKLEKARFEKNRVVEELKAMRIKAKELRAQTEGMSVLGKLKQELAEYRGILKCGNCHDRQKEVVIAKCYHLFCNHCVQRTLESRHRKCPTCSASFGPNDVKPIYI